MEINFIRDSRKMPFAAENKILAEDKASMNYTPFIFGGLPPPGLPLEIGIGTPGWSQTRVLIRDFLISVKFLKKCLERYVDIYFSVICR